MNELFEEERIPTKPKERLKTFLLSDIRKEEVDIINDYQLSSYNASQFNLMVNNMYDNYEKLIAVFSEKMFKELSIHPSYGKYFMSVWEEEKKVSPNDDFFKGLEIWALTREQMSKVIEKIMEWLREIYPMVKVYMDISRSVNDKYYIRYPDVERLVKEAKEDGVREYLISIGRRPQAAPQKEADKSLEIMPSLIGEVNHPQVATPLEIQENKTKRVLIREALARGERNRDIARKFGIKPTAVPAYANLH